MTTLFATLTKKQKLALAKRDAPCSTTRRATGMYDRAVTDAVLAQYDAYARKVGR